MNSNAAALRHECMHFKRHNFTGQLVDWVAFHVDGRTGLYIWHNLDRLTLAEGIIEPNGQSFYIMPLSSLMRHAAYLEAYEGLLSFFKNRAEGAL